MAVLTVSPVRLALVAAVLVACAGTEPTASPSSPPIASSASASAPPAVESAAAPPPAPALAGGWSACGPLSCRTFAKPDEALRALLDEEKPLVIGFGEAHAQKGAETIASTAARATHQLLPVLGGRASDLVLELWVADGSCGKKKEEKVAQQQKQVTEKQATTNTNEYVVLAERAKALGIQPHVIKPTCEEIDRIVKAGDDSVLEMMTMITHHMREKLSALGARPGAGEKIVLTYGGALHNDLKPREGREGWSFGPAISTATRGRYLEIDLVVPEYVKETPAWTGQAWYPAWDPARTPDQVTVIRTAEHAFAMVLPRGVSKDSVAPSAVRAAPPAPP